MELLTVKSYARRRGVSLGAVYAQLWSGRLPAVKRDRVWEIPMEPDQPATLPVEGLASATVPSSIPAHQTRRSL